MSNNDGPKKEILFLANCGISSTMLSGGEIRFIEITKKWNNFSNIFVMLPRVSSISFKNQGLKGKYVPLPFSFLDKLGIIFAYFTRTIIACFLILKYRKQIVYSTSDFIPDVIPAFIAKIFFPKTIWVVSLHHLIPHFNKRQGNKIVNFISYFAQKISLFFIKHFTDKIIIISKEFSKKYTFKSYFQSQNGIDYDFIKDSVIDNKHSFDGIFLGRLSYSKGIFDLIDIWKKVTTAFPDAKLGMIGGGSDIIVNQLSTKIKLNGIENNVSILGFLPKNKIFSILKTGKIFVFPSHEEGWGISIAEAMACSLPVICYNLEAYKNIFNTGNIIKISKFDINKFAKEILKLLSDPTRIKKMVNISIEESKKISWEKIANMDWEYINS